MTRAPNPSPSTQASGDPGPADDRDREISQLLSRLQRQAENVRSLQNALSDRERELRDIHGSKLWRVASHYWRLRRGITKILARMRPGRREESHAIFPGAAVPPPPAFDVICFSIIEWSFRHQRPQQLASALADRGHRVFFLNPAQFLPVEHPSPYVVRELRPRILEVTLRAPRFDVHSGVLGTQAEQAIVDSLSALAAEHHIAAAVSLVETATWRAAALRLRATRAWPVAYDCMDEWRNFPGIAPAMLLEEEALASSADLVITSSQTLLEKWRAVARAAVLVRNGADFEFFNASAETRLRAGRERPVIGYFGAIAEWVDVPLVVALARARPEYDFILVGGVFGVDVSELESLPNVSLPGQQAYVLMPGYLASFDVCIIPFQVNEITAATDPVKFYEYLSQGKPVVTTRLPELDEYRGVFREARTHSEFLIAIDEALREDSPEAKEKRIALARANSWTHRAGVVASEISGTFPRVSIVIATWNGLEVTKQCLASVLADGNHPNFEVVVVDNASDDGTVDYLRMLSATDSRVRALFNERNEGFAKAINRGLLAAGGDYFVILNNDVVVPRGWLHPITRHLADDAIGEVVSVTNFAGNEARIDVPYRDLSAMEPFAWRYTRAHHGRTFDIAVAALYCVGIRRNVWESVGPLDEGYEIGMFEDDDYSHRIRLAGLRVVCAEDSFVHHFGRASFSMLPQSEYDEIWRRNQQRFETKWGIKWVPHRLRSQSRASSSSTSIHDTSSYEQSIALEAGKWSRHLEVEKSGVWNAWLDHPSNAAHYEELSRVEGKPWPEWLASAFGRPAAHCLDLGCGSGGTSFKLHASGAVRRVEGFDISAERIAEAEKRRVADGIEGEFRVGDVNKLRFAPGAYDLVVSSHSFHHFLELEHIMSEVAGALTDDGLFVLEEFVGPTRFQWTSEQQEVVRALLSLIPQRLRLLRWNVAKTEERNPSVADVVAESPFESIRSGEITQLFRKHFDVVHSRPLGGTIQHLLYNGIMHHFREDDEEAMRFLTAVRRVEDGLIDTGALPSDFMLLIGRKRRSVQSA